MRHQQIDKGRDVCQRVYAWHGQGREEAVVKLTEADRPKASKADPKKKRGKKNSDHMMMSVEQESFLSSSVDACRVKVSASS